MKSKSEIQVNQITKVLEDFFKKMGATFVDCTPVKSLKKNERSIKNKRNRGKN
jgi:hypothetical protein